ncbi:hypothetical protein BJX99DRAFT_218742 [Aspergillus californicus]
MSRPTPPTAASSRGFGGTKTAGAHDTSGLFQTLQGHVDEIRGLIQCGICIRPLYEPFTLACGHTFCYGCLTSWFAEGSSNKTCPDCRAPVKSEPAPAYLVRAVVQLFTSRAELLDKGETTDQHKTHSVEEAQKLETDKKNPNPKDGGLFRGIFNKKRPNRPIVDLEDNVVRCPECSWELDEAGCVNCGYRQDDDSMSGTDYRSDSGENSEMTDDAFDDAEFDVDVDVDVDHDIPDDFGRAPQFDWNEWNEGLSADEFPPQTQFRYNPFGFGRHGLNIMAGGTIFHGHPGLDSQNSTHDSDGDEDEDEDEDEEEDEEEEDDEEMGSFIDDDQPSDDHASDSGRSTIVGHPSYSRAEIHAIFNEPPGSAYGTIHPNVYDFHAIPDTEGEEDEDLHHGEGELHHGDYDDDDEDDDENDGDDDVDDGDDEDEDDEEEPIPPAVAGNRRIPTYHIISSSPHANTEAARTFGSNNTHWPRQGRQLSSTASSTSSAITIDDESDDDSDEGPVGPTRRARDRGIGGP